jgi:hypothetical protein
MPLEKTSRKYSLVVVCVCGKLCYFRCNKNIRKTYFIAVHPDGSSCNPTSNFFILPNIPRKALALLSELIARGRAAIDLKADPERKKAAYTLMKKGLAEATVKKKHSYMVIEPDFSFTLLIKSNGKSLKSLREKLTHAKTSNQQEVSEPKEVPA